MPITAITLENFRAFSKPTRFELRPITLLVGPNNSGKSSVTKALTTFVVDDNDPFFSDESVREHGLVDLFNRHSGSPTMTFGFENTDYAGSVVFELDREIKPGNTNVIRWKNCDNQILTISSEDDFQTEIVDAYPFMHSWWEHFVLLDIDLRCLSGVLGSTIPEWASPDIPWRSKTRAKHAVHLLLTTLKEVAATDAFQEEAELEEEALAWRRAFVLEHALPAFFNAFDVFTRAVNQKPVTVTAAGHRVQRVYLVTGSSPMDKALWQQYASNPSLPQEENLKWVRMWMETLGIGTDLKLESLENQAATLQVKRPEWTFRFAPEERLQNLKSQLLEMNRQRGEDPRRWLFEVEKEKPNDWSINRSIKLTKEQWWGYDFDEETAREAEEAQAAAQQAEAQRLAGMSEGEIAAERLEEEAMEAELRALYAERKRAKDEHEKRSLKDGWVHLADLGFGFTRLMPLLLRSAYGSKETYIVEEPETNLHPNLQSKLADLFVDMAGRGQRLLVETHSEYLIRKLQYLVATGQAKPEDIVIYYLGPDPTADDHVREITLDERGALSQPFGPGFYDEATNLMADLFRFQARN